MHTKPVGTGRPIRDLPDALDRFPDVADFIGERSPLLFLDFDGTLSPIVTDPMGARLLPELRDVLNRLVAEVPVAVVSGRARRDVEARVGVPGAVYAGSHGLDISGPGLSQRVEGDAGSALARAARRARDLLQHFPGATLERKDLGVAIHYRQLHGATPDALEAAVLEIAEEEPTLRMIHGKKVFDLRPAVDWDKGDALRWLERRMGGSGPDTTVVYIGDDITDEDAFRKVDASGLPIVVRGENDARRSAARYALSGPRDVAAFLERLLELLEKRGTV